MEASPCATCPIKKISLSPWWPERGQASWKTSTTASVYLSWLMRTITATTHTCTHTLGYHDDHKPCHHINRQELHPLVMKQISQSHCYFMCVYERRLLIGRVLCPHPHPKTVTLNSCEDVNGSGDAKNSWIIFRGLDSFHSLLLDSSCRPQTNRTSIERDSIAQFIYCHRNSVWELDR